MNNAKKRIVAVVAVLTMAFVMGMFSDGLEFGDSDHGASANVEIETLYLAGDFEDGNGGG